MQYLFFFLDLDSHVILIIRSRSSAYEQSVPLSYIAWQVIRLLHEAATTTIESLWFPFCEREYLGWGATTRNKELPTKFGKPISRSSIDRKLFHWVSWGEVMLIHEKVGPRFLEEDATSRESKITPATCPSKTLHQTISQQTCSMQHTFEFGFS